MRATLSSRRSEPLVLSSQHVSKTTRKRLSGMRKCYKRRLGGNASGIPPPSIRGSDPASKRRMICSQDQRLAAGQPPSEQHRQRGAERIAQAAHARVADLIEIGAQRAPLGGVERNHGLVRLPVR